MIMTSEPTLREEVFSGKSWSKTIGLSKNKSLELQFDWKTSNSYAFEMYFNISSRRDHAGTEFRFALRKLFYFGIIFSDNRHYDYENEKYYEPKVEGSSPNGNL